MATDLERLVVQLSADFKKYENALNKAMGVTNRQARNIERRFQSMNRNLSGQFTSLGRSLAGAFALAGGIRGAQTLIDTSTQIQNALKVTGLEGETLARVYDRLFQSAQRNMAPLETLAQLYSRIGLAQSQLGVSQEDMLQFTDRVALALRVQGTTAQEARGALIQLSQAMGAGIVRAEEFNSIVEGAPSILRATAAGLKEAGGSVAKLRQLVIDGKLPSKAFFDAFLAGAPMLEKMVANAEVTVSQHLIRLRNVLIDAAGDFDKGSGAAEAFGKMLSDVADIISQTDFSKMGEEIAKYIGWVNDARIAVMSWLQAHGAAVGRDLGLDAIGEMITGGAAVRQLGPLTITSSKALQRRIDEAFGIAVETAGGLTEQAIQEAYQRRGQATAGGKTSRIPSTTVKTVSLDDYDKPSTGTKGRKSTKERADDYERLSRRIADSTAALVAETEVQRQLNPLVDDYGYAVEKARTEQELLSAAQKAGIAITPELRKEIAGLAEQYALATVEAAKLAEAQDEARENAEDFKALGQDVLGGFIKDLRDGKSAADALQSALAKVADRLLDMALTGLFSGKGFGRGGLFGGMLIPGILHGGGVAGRDGYGHGRAVSPSVFSGAQRYHSGGIAGLQPGEVPAILQKGEVVLPRGTKMGGGTSIVINAPISAPGADAAQLARVEASVKELGRNVPKMVDQRVNTRQTRNTRP